MNHRVVLGVDHSYFAADLFHLRHQIDFEGIKRIVLLDALSQGNQTGIQHELWE